MLVQLFQQRRLAQHDLVHRPEIPRRSLAPEAADAEVFALFDTLLAPLGLRAATGDIGILMAAVRGLDTTPRRKAALLRHIWRPNRFRALLDRFSGRAPIPAARAALLDRLAADSPEALTLAAGTHVGLRSAADSCDTCTWPPCPFSLLRKRA